MSHRTEDLPPLQGIPRIVRELRYHEASRQLLAMVLIALYAVIAQPTEWFLAVGAPLAAVGTVMRLYASGFIMKNETLATSGPYALVRHPLYTGNILIIIGFSIASAVWWTLPLALIFFCFYYPPAIEYEDRKLRRLFGSQWEAWANGTPALMPTLRNVGAVGNGAWSLSKSAKRNGEPIIVLFILSCLALVAWKLP